VTGAIIMTPGRWRDSCGAVYPVAGVLHCVFLWSVSGEELRYAERRPWHSVHAVRPGACGGHKHCLL